MANNNAKPIKKARKEFALNKNANLKKEFSAIIAWKTTTKIIKKKSKSKAHLSNNAKNKSLKS